MRAYEVTIRGISPLLMHRNSPEMDELLKKQKNNEARMKVEKENFELYAYKDEQGYYIPQLMLIRCLVEAAKEFRQEGRGKKTYKNIVGGGFILIEPEKIRLKCDPPACDLQYVKVQNNRVLRARPRFDKWEASFKMWIADGIDPDVILAILKHAGLFHGLGDFRPNRGGPYGRFEVVRFEEAK